MHGIGAEKASGWMTRFRWAIAERMVSAENRRARERLRKIPDLWREINDYREQSEVTGASWSDYWQLYSAVRKYHPREVLEFGPGISTLVLAYALKENERDGHGAGRLTSMEDVPEWRDDVLKLLPAHYQDCVEIVFSPKVDGYYRMFRGVQYERIPDRPYDFIFSDGPERHSNVNGDKLFDLDLIHVVRRSERPVRALVDNHYLTFYVFQKVFGTELARYSVRHRLMFIGPVCRSDARYLRKENFHADIRIFGTTELKLRMARSSI
ncbi:hypothetical protein [Roseibium sp.]|uniref:hypothetical protein n=1 Tax=Roseibium sp. TaxID=1936156 RepID=UPI003A983353